MDICPLSKMVSTTFPTFLEFFSNLFVHNYTVPKNYIIGHKTNKNSTRYAKIWYMVQNRFLFQWKTTKKLDIEYFLISVQCSLNGYMSPFKNGFDHFSNSSGFFFSHLFVRNYSVPKKYIIGNKTNRKSNTGVKIGYVMQNMFVFCQKIISPQKVHFQIF